MQALPAQVLHDVSVRLHPVQKVLHPKWDATHKHHISLLCKADLLLLVGMDQTPGSKDESLVAESQRLGEEVGVERRVQLLISFTTQVVFGYVAQVWPSLSVVASCLIVPACQFHAGMHNLDC